MPGAGRLCAASVGVVYRDLSNSLEFTSILEHCCCFSFFFFFSQAVHVCCFGPRLQMGQFPTQEPSRFMWSMEHQHFRAMRAIGGPSSPWTPWTTKPNDPQRRLNVLQVSVLGTKNKTVDIRGLSRTEGYSTPGALKAEVRYIEPELFDTSLTWLEEAPSSPKPPGPQFWLQGPEAEFDHGCRCAGSIFSTAGRNKPRKPSCGFFQSLSLVWGKVHGKKKTKKHSNWRSRK